jgi:hypothetical protein
VIARFPGDITAQHVQNFLECCHSRKLPNADVYIGHRAASIRKARKFCRFRREAAHRRSSMAHFSI